ncbi:hypothetical protein [Pyxidicoccus xibeiensis]|uniref:hypothetical protein n=1 Tax=Pyxidicoccus xibeiensis TaxID=2906759 RepID=UPI0020A70A54|nr:hypothetical protein [Pyxidicoccus xibeiensis]MCP3136946.1 hypothetical protein [Pyxidicoccus xibeiensis]
MSKARLLGRGLTLAVCLWLVLPLHTAWAQGPFERHVAEAVRLYEDLEYEQALAVLESAGTVARGPDEEATLGLYKGIISADLGRWDAARARFRAALQLKPDARLPLKVSPKVSREFESQRAKVQAELTRKRKVAQSRPVIPVPEPVTPVEPSLEPPPPTETPVAEVARPDLVPSSSEAAAEAEVAASRKRRVPVVSLVLLGAGVAAGGVGTVFGLSSRSQLEDARLAPQERQLEDLHGKAQSSATTANILFGTAGLAAAGAVVTWLLMGDSEAPVAQEGAR